MDVYHDNEYFHSTADLPGFCLPAASIGARV
jgi:hypothetical protein